MADSLPKAGPPGTTAELRPEQHQRQLEQELNALRRLPGPEWLSGAEVWYARLAGFFVIEDVLRKATSPASHATGQPPPL